MQAYGMTEVGLTCQHPSPNWATLDKSSAVAGILARNNPKVNYYAGYCYSFGIFVFYFKRTCFPFSWTGRTVLQTQGIANLK
jgi:hypothetical protein